VSGPTILILSVYGHRLYRCASDGSDATATPVTADDPLAHDRIDYVSGRLTVDKHSAYVVSMKSNLLAVDLMTGKERTLGPAFADPVLARGRLFALRFGGALYRIDPTSGGKEYWGKGYILGSPVFGGDVVGALDQQGNLIGISPEE
jgi:hypothetical protein